MPTYKYYKNLPTGIQTDVMRLDDNGSVSWISLSDPDNHNYKDWKEWEASGNTTETAD